MPVTFSFELEGAVHDAELIGSLIERMGWERLDASTYRYPRLALQCQNDSSEDWLNHIAPALMLFRCFVLSRELTLRSYTLETNSSAGYRRADDVGSPPLHAENVRLCEPSSAMSDAPGRASEDRQSEEWAVLRDWLDANSFPPGL